MAANAMKLVSKEALLYAAEGLMSPEVAEQLWEKLQNEPTSPTAHAIPMSAAGETPVDDQGYYRANRIPPIYSS